MAMSWDKKAIISREWNVTQFALLFCISAATFNQNLKSHDSQLFKFELLRHFLFWGYDIFYEFNMNYSILDNSKLKSGTKI